jgi:hypothetical protein
VEKNQGIIVYEVDNPKMFKLLNAVMLLELKHQGLTAEKSTLQKSNQGVCTDVSKYHPCLSAAADGYFLFSTCPDSSGEKKVTNHN